MFGVSLYELIIIMAVVLLVFGPERLPEIARSLCRLMGQLKRTSDSIRREFYQTVYTPTDQLGEQVRREVFQPSAEQSPNQSQNPRTQSHETSSS